MSGARADTPRYIRGVPHPLPEGECLLWEGAPAARAVATHVFHWRPLVGYFGVVLLLWMMAAEAPVGSPAFRAGLLPRLGLAVVAVAVAVGTAAAVARTTWYAITTHRVVLRIGMVLPMTINIPFTLLQSADVGVFRDGTGQLRLVLARPHRLAYIALWPHCRPFALAHPEPLLRGLADPRKVGAILARAVAARAEEGAVQVATRSPTPAREGTASLPQPAGA
jgi:hypothetical protein